MIDFIRMRWLIRRVPLAKWDQERKMASATRTTASITGMPRGGGGNIQEARLIDLAMAEEAYREVIDELNARRKELSPLIDRLEDVDDKGIMRLRYLQGYSPEEIADLVYMSRSGVYGCLKRAERRIREMSA